MGFSTMTFVGSSNSTENRSDSIPSFSLANLELLVCTVLSAFSIVANVRVFCIVATMGPKRRKKNVLIAHLSIVGISIQCFGMVYMLKKRFDLVFPSSTALCALESFIRNMLFCVEPLNIGLIYFQRCHALGPDNLGNKIGLIQSICLIWTAAFVGNLPVLLMSQTLGHSCLRIPLFGSIYATASFEILKLAVYNMIPSAYIIYSLYRIKSKVTKYINPSGRKVKEKKVRKVQLLLWYSVAFLLIWFPKSIILVFHKVYQRASAKIQKDPPVGPVPIPSYFGIITIASTVFIMLLPLINLHLNEDLRHIRWWQFKYNRNRRNCSSKKRAAIVKAISKRTGQDIEPSVEHGSKPFGFSTIEMQSTVAATSASDNAEVQNVRLEEVAIDLHRQEEISPCLSPEESPVKETLV